VKVRFTRKAQANLGAIFRHVSADNPEVAATLVLRIERLIEKLALYPQLGRRTEPPGRRVLTVPGIPYRVFYRITENEIRILTVRHTSRRPLRVPG
jgi:toxin ParE1/3/4